MAIADAGRHMETVEELPPPLQIGAVAVAPDVVIGGQEKAGIVGIADFAVVEADVAVKPKLQLTRTHAVKDQGRLPATRLDRGPHLAPHPRHDAGPVLAQVVVGHDVARVLIPEVALEAERLGNLPPVVEPEDVAVDIADVHRQGRRAGAAGMFFIVGEFEQMAHPS